MHGIMTKYYICIQNTTDIIVSLSLSDFDFYTSLTTHHAGTSYSSIFQYLVSKHILHDVQVKIIQIYIPAIENQVYINDTVS